MTDKLRDDFSATASKEVANIMAVGPYGYAGYAMIDAIVRREIARARAAALEEAAEIDPGQLSISAADLPHVVWQKYRDAIRALSKRDDGQG